MVSISDDSVLVKPTDDEADAVEGPAETERDDEGPDVSSGVLSLGSTPLPLSGCSDMVYRQSNVLPSASLGQTTEILTARMIALRSDNFLQLASANRIARL